jgi:hypothetical protein
MKLNFHHKLLFTLLFLLTISTGMIYAQETEAAPTLLSLKYFLPENKVPYITVITRKKIGRKFEPVPGVTINVYLTSVTPASLVGKVTTAVNGEGRVAFPAALKANWEELDAFTIIAQSVPAGKEESLTEELPVKKAILVIDTANEDGIRNVTGMLREKKGSEWVAVADVEMKLKVKRALGNLTLGDAESYTSDSSGTASAVFIRDSIPGDEKGNIVLVASVEDNDSYGNLVVEKTV